MNIKELKKRARTLNPNLRIGKAGLTDGVLKEIREQLKKRKLIKIRILKSAIEQENEIIIELIRKTDATLVSRFGFVVAIYKERYK